MRTNISPGVALAAFCDVFKVIGAFACDSDIAMNLLSFHDNITFDDVKHVFFYV